MLQLIKDGTELFRFIQNKNNPERVVIIPDTIKTLNPIAFSNKDATGVKMVYLPDSITEIPARCFQGSTVLYVRTSPKLKQIYDYAFDRCHNLTHIYVPDDCKLGTRRFDGSYLNGETVFSNCPSLRRYTPWIQYHATDKELFILWQCANGELHESTERDPATFKPIEDKNLVSKGYYVIPRPKVTMYYRVIERIKPTSRIKDGIMPRTGIMVVKPD